MSLEGFELFVGGRSFRGGVKPQVTIAKNGTITINKAASDAWKDVPTFVQMLYNAKINAIALKPSEEGDPGAYTLRPSLYGGKPTGAHSLGGKTFLQRYNIDISQGVQSEPRFDEGALVFDIR